jgi:hypothetical protein
VVALGLEPFGQRPSDQGFIVDDEHGSVWHGANPKQSAAVQFRVICARAMPAAGRPFSA